jgi:hypothetical protein
VQRQPSASAVRCRILLSALNEADVIVVNIFGM